MSKGGRSEGNLKWEKEIFEALMKVIDKGERYWSVPVMVSWIKERYGREIPESPMALRKWTVVDAQGIETGSSLLSARFAEPLDRKLFQFRDPRIFKDD